jgi:hypothetical protein
MNRRSALAILSVMALMAAVLVGYCRLATDDGASIADRAKGYVVEWQSAGMYLPEQEQLQFFRQHFAETKMILAASLSDQRREVRTRGAFVIEQLGTEAGSLSSAVIDSLAAEKDEGVRVYLINAARASGKGDAAVLDALRKLYRAPTSEKEEFYVAAALFVLSDNSDERAAAEACVCKYLLPYERSDQRHSRADYDDLRWSAVNAVEHMIGATKPIPLLENMLGESGAKPWVGAHVPRALNVLRTAGASVATQAAVEGRDEGSTRQ